MSGNLPVECQRRLSHMIVGPDELSFSGKRFGVTYRLTGSEAEARRKAEDICIEQTIEFPADLVSSDSSIRSDIFGRVERFRFISGELFEADISFAVEVVGREITQLINIIFGNISIKRGIRVIDVKLPPLLLSTFKGPRFGVPGLRKLLGVRSRPVLSTALKPMGLPADELADMAYAFALGGIDIIKDDHGLADQPFSPFRERVEKCTQAIARANRKTGYKSIYVPNITALPDEMTARAKFAKEVGAGGVMVAPGLSGFGTMQAIAADDAIALPVISHPSFLGAFVTCEESGLSHGFLFGILMRLAGADVTVFPNYGGRFPFSRKDCEEIAQFTSRPMAHIKPIFPAPGGGMSMEKLQDMSSVYGSDVVFLIGGDLYRHSASLAESARRFRRQVQGM